MERVLEGQKAGNKNRGYTHEVECVFLCESIADGGFLKLEELVQVVVEVGVSLIDFAGSFERETFCRVWSAKGPRPNSATYLALPWKTSPSRQNPSA